MGGWKYSHENAPRSPALPAGIARAHKATTVGWMETNGWHRSPPEQNLLHRHTQTLNSLAPLSTLRRHLFAPHHRHDQWKNRGRRHKRARPGSVAPARSRVCSFPTKHTRALSLTPKSPPRNPTPPSHDAIGRRFFAPPPSAAPHPLNPIGSSGDIKGCYTSLEQQVVDLNAGHLDVLLMVEIGYHFHYFCEDTADATAVLNIVANLESTTTASSPPASPPSASVRPSRSSPPPCRRRPSSEEITRSAPLDFLEETTTLKRLYQMQMLETGILFFPAINVSYSVTKSKMHHGVHHNFARLLHTQRCRLDFTTTRDGFGAC